MERRYTVNMGLVALMICLIQLKVVTPQFISAPPENVQSTVGKRISFNCTIGNRTTALVSWQKLGRPAILLFTNTRKIYRIPGESRETQKFKISERTHKDGNVTFQLTVNNVVEDDTGTYLCMVLKNGKYLKATANLLVLIPPSFEKGTPRLIKGVEGHNATLFCNTSGTPMPEITWSRLDRRPLPHGSHSVHGAKYFIELLSRNDSGTYICKADNRVHPSPIRLDVKLEVSFPAKVRALVEEVGQKPNKGYEARLVCIATGFPRPGTRWYKVMSDGSEREVVADFKKFSMHNIAGVEDYSHDLQAQLTIHKVDTMDFGNYTCRVNNGFGQDNAYILFYRVSYVPGSEAHIESKALSDPEAKVNKKETRYVMDDGGNRAGVISYSVLVTLIALALPSVT